MTNHLKMPLTSSKNTEHIQIFGVSVPTRRDRTFQARAIFTGFVNQNRENNLTLPTSAQNSHTLNSP